MSTEHQQYSTNNQADKILEYASVAGAGFGLRRVLLDQSGNLKSALQRGEHKSLQTDRVILVPGADQEVATVNQMFQWLIQDDLAISAIANRLNGLRVLTDLDRPWNYSTVRQVLTNEKYIGNNVYNRHPFKLKKKHVERCAARCHPAHHCAGDGTGQAMTSKPFFL